MRLLGILALLVLSTSLFAEELRVDAIEFEGNEKTLAQTMLQELTFSAGDTVTEADIEKGRQSIMNLRLFKEVTAEIINKNSAANTLVYTVAEKRYLLILPRLSRSGDGDWSYGARIRWDNLGGKDRRLDFGVRRKDLKNSDVQQEDRIQLRYRIPRIWGSDYNVFMDLRSEDLEIDEERDGRTGIFEQRQDSFRFNISRWLRQRGPSQGWLARARFMYESYVNDFIEGDSTLFFDADIVETSFGVEFQEVHDLGFNRRGKHFGYDIQAASDSLGSDVSYVRHNLFYRGYRPLRLRPHTNFNYQLQYRTSSGSVFGDPSYSLGGNSSLRGYDRESQEGESIFIANLEFLTPVFGNNHLRGVLFADIGGAFDDSADFDTDKIVTGLGFGILYKLRSFVKTDLRLDVGYGIDDGETKVYGATETSF